jgi:4-hydroxy-3-methylbut-2-enyl diphosphate reductase
MKISRAAHLGMCFGVRDAIGLALQHARRTPLSILGDLVHNPAIVSSLRAEGIQTVHSPAQVTTPAVMITAHGASERAMNRVRDLGLEVVEATCPLVHHAHRAVAALVHDGFHPVIIGKRGHVEVRGLTEDLAEFDIVLSEEDIMELRPRARFGVAAQTTQPIDRVRRLVAFLRQRFPEAEVRFADTVCQPTKQRQAAAIALAQQCDVVVVIGGAESNNTRELAATCAAHCPQVHHVQTAADLRPEWFAFAQSVGVTAGTSTPDVIIDAVESWLHELAAQQAASAEAWGRPTFDGAPRELEVELTATHSCP